MPGVGWKTLLTVSVLLSTAAIADEDISPAKDDQATQGVMRSVDELVAELESASRWHYSQSFDATSYAYDWSYPFAELNFQDESAFARISRLRSLSLLTLGEIGDSQLFLGINERGLLGVHFNAFPRADNKRLLEVARMPYLQEDEQDSETTH